MKALAAALIALCCAAPPALRAQVYRCVDSGTGNVTYSDEHCPKGAASGSGLIEAPRTPQEIAQERAQAREAQQRNYEQQERLARLQQMEAERQRLQPPSVLASPYAAGIDGAACQQSLRDLQALLGRSTALPPGADPEIERAQYRMDLACLGPALAAQNAAEREAYAAPPVAVWGGGWAHRPLPVRPADRPAHCVGIICRNDRGDRFMASPGAVFNGQNGQCRMFNGTMRC